MIVKFAVAKPGIGERSGAGGIAVSGNVEGVGSTVVVELESVGTVVVVAASEVVVVAPPVGALELSDPTA